MFFILSAASLRRKPTLLADFEIALKARGPVFSASTAPRTNDAEADRVALQALIESRAKRHPPKIVFALDPASAKVAWDHPALKNARRVFAPLQADLGNEFWNGESGDEAFRADELWISNGKRSVPAALSGKAAFVPRSASRRGWIDRRVRRLLKTKNDFSGRFPLTSLIVPVYNGLPALKRCLASLRKHTRLPHEIIVVDNGSSAPTASYLRNRRGIRLIRNPENLGFAKAVNQGMRAARGRYIGWINSDTVCTPEWLERMIEPLQADRNLGAVGPMTNRTAGAQRVKIPRGLDPKGVGLERYARAWSLMHAGKRKEVHRLTGFFTLLKQRAVEEVGLLDERFGAGCYEDYDYCLRLRQAGYGLAAVLDVFVYHEEHASFESDEAFQAQCAANREIFIRKWTKDALRFLDQIDPELSYEPRSTR